jgi:hypothetical protein
MTRLLFWLWERTERLRLRIDLWAVRVRIRETQAEYDNAPDPALNPFIFRALAAQRRHHATLLRTLAIMDGRPVPTATETADNPPGV